MQTIRMRFKKFNFFMLFLSLLISFNGYSAPVKNVNTKTKKTVTKKPTTKSKSTTYKQNQILANLDAQIAKTKADMEKEIKKQEKLKNAQKTGEDTLQDVEGNIEELKSTSSDLSSSEDDGFFGKHKDTAEAAVVFVVVGGALGLAYKYALKKPAAALIKSLKDSKYFNSAVEMADKNIAKAQAKWDVAQAKYDKTRPGTQARTQAAKELDAAERDYHQTEAKAAEAKIKAKQAELDVIAKQNDVLVQAKEEVRLDTKLSPKAKEAKLNSLDNKLTPVKNNLDNVAKELEGFKGELKLAQQNIDEIAKQGTTALERRATLSFADDVFPSTGIPKVTDFDSFNITYEPVSPKLSLKNMDELIGTKYPELQAKLQKSATGISDDMIRNLKQAGLTDDAIEVMRKSQLSDDAIKTLQKEIKASSSLADDLARNLSDDFVKALKAAA